MKMIREDYQALSTVILAELEAMPANKKAYYIACSAKRFRWHLAYIADVDFPTLYRYLDDTHIDTALRAIVKGAQV
jgi:hypothetical protein